MAALLILHHVNLMSYIRINSLRDSLFSVEGMNEIRSRKSRVPCGALQGSDPHQQIQQMPPHSQAWAVLGQVFNPLALPGSALTHMRVKLP